MIMVVDKDWNIVRYIPEKGDVVRYANDLGERYLLKDRKGVVVGKPNSIELVPVDFEGEDTIETYDQNLLYPCEDTVITSCKMVTPGKGARMPYWEPVAMSCPLESFLTSYPRSLIL